MRNRGRQWFLYPSLVFLGPVKTLAIAPIANLVIPFLLPPRETGRGVICSPSPLPCPQCKFTFRPTAYETFEELVLVQLAVFFTLFFQGTSWDRIEDLQRRHPGMLFQLVL